MKRALYLPSTPLNTLMSVAHAADHKNSQQAKLWLIDQKHVRNNPYYDVLKTSELSLFDDIRCFGAGSATVAKRKDRIALFEQFKRALAEEAISDIFVGNDRRIEFQFLMHWLSHQSQNVTGHYMDDGLYSYAGKPSVWYKDGVNALLKKLFYGFWWDEPKTVGASHWIDDVWVMDTKLLHPALKMKQQHTINPEIFKSREVVNFSQNLLGFFNETPESYQQFDLVLLLPHPNNIKKMDGYEVKLKQLIKNYVGQGMSIAAKYHPRMEGDALGLVSLGVTKIIPSAIAFEFILPLLKSDSRLLADIGSALFMAKKLRPDLDSVAVLDEKDPFQKRFLSLFERAGITIKSHGELFG